MDKINKHKIPYLYKGNPFLGTFSLVPFQNNLFDNRFLPNNNPIIGMIRHAPKINDNYINNLYQNSKSSENLQNINQENNKQNKQNKQNKEKKIQKKNISTQTDNVNVNSIAIQANMITTKNNDVDDYEVI